MRAAAAVRRGRWALPLALAALILAGCDSGPGGDATGGPSGGSGTPATSASGTPGTSQAAKPTPTPTATSVYAHTAPQDLAAVVRDDPPLVYVPDTLSNDVYVVDQKTMKVVRKLDVGGLNQHVVPSWDLKTLWVTASTANELIAIDPNTGKLTGRRVHVRRPYNMYFTPDGKFAIVVSEDYKTLRFLRTSDMKEVHDLRIDRCDGIDHMDFSADGKTALATCEFSGEHGKVGLLAVVDVPHQKLLSFVTLSKGAKPQDVKLSPDGKTFYVADMDLDGVHVIDAKTLRRTAFIPTGKEAHGLYVSRDQKYLYVANRGEGSVSLIDFATNKVAKKWKIPGGGSPDMGNINADGSRLWLSGRYDNEVYVFDTTTGKVLKKIPVGDGPHGLCVWPQPGRYSIGHTGIMR